jgi:hypothetical protein
MVFICPQERSSAFGPCICEEMKTLPQKFGNVFVTATKSGKLQKETYKCFFRQCNKSVCEKKKFSANS